MRDMYGRRRGLALALAATLAFGPAGAALGYENNQRSDTLGGGTHRKINKMAGALFLREIVKGQQGAAFKRYDFQPLSPSNKYKVIALNADVPGDLLTNLFKPAGLTINARVDWRDATYEAAQKTENFAFSKWVIEGGFTADEPEKFMSLRHFYNPMTNLGPAYLTDIPPVTGRYMGPNPQIDAVTWATTHADNQFNWTKGGEYLAAAFAAADAAEAQRNYAAAWRSLGETMHLAADMTVPAHVRNDSHPGDWRGAALLDDLRSDAYEYLTNWAHIDENGWTGRQPDPDLLATIRASATPDDLLTTVAAWVNSHFFSSDTIPYVNWLGTTTANNVGRFSGVGAGNGIVYPAPTLPGMTYDEKTGYYSAPDSTGKPMLMAHTSWLDDDGWGTYPGLVNSYVVESQAQRLIPAAVWGGERLMELFVPLVEMKVTAVETDEETKAPLITGEVAVRRAKQGGGYADKSAPNDMKYTSQSVLLFVRLTKKDGATEERIYLAPPTWVKDGTFEISLEDCTKADGLRGILFPPEGATPAYTKIEYGVGLDMGGILVRSDYFADEGIVGMWDVVSTFDDVVIPPELLDTTGMSDEEAAAYIKTIKTAYGGGLLGQTFQSTAEIVANGAAYILKPQYDEKTAALMAAGGYTMDLATKLIGNTMRAESKTTLGVGSATSVIQAEVSADRKSMDGTLETKMITQAGQGSITVVYKGTWKATKQE